MKDGLVIRNVAALVEPPREAQKHEPAVFTLEQARAFLDVVRGHRLEALFSVALSLGLRKGEVLGVRWQDVDFYAGTLSGKLPLVEPKTEKSRRTIRLPQVAVASLHTHRLPAGTGTADRGQQVGRNGNGLHDQHWHDARCPKPAQSLLRDHEVSYRTCRTSDFMTFGTVPLRSCWCRVSIRKSYRDLGGWSDIRIVLNTYSHVIPALKDEGAAKMDSILSPVLLRRKLLW